MTIIYQNEVDFYDGIRCLIMEGLTFEADHATLTITLTGGY
jgi:hypothetical protein